MSKNASGSSYAWAIAVACVAFYAVPLGFGANHNGLFITPIMNQFGWSQTEATLFLSIQPWVAALCTPIAGKLISRYNPRWIMTAAVVAFGLAHLSCAFFTQPWQWDIYGVVYGASAAFWMYIATPTMINRWFAKSNGTVIGVIGVVSSMFAAIMSPVVQGWITAYGWQTARLVCGAIVTLVGGGLTAALLRESPQKMGVKPWGYSANAGATASDDVIDVAAEQGLTREQAMKNPALWMLILMAGMLVISAAFNQQISHYAQVNDSLGASVGAFAFSILMVAAMIGKFSLGWICDHVGARIAGVVAGLCGIAGPSVMLAGTSNPNLFYVGVFLFGIAFAALTIVPPMLCRQAFGNKDYANIYSVVATGLNAFAGFSAIIYARIFDLSGSYVGAFYMMIAFYIVVTVLSLVIVPLGRKDWAGKPVAA